MQAALTVLLTAGCLLSLPVYWWLLVAPITGLWRRHQARKRQNNTLH